MSKIWVPLKEAATRTGFSVATLEKMLRKNYIRSDFGSSGEIRVRVIDVVNATEKHGMSTEFKPKTVEEIAAMTRKERTLPNGYPRGARGFAVMSYMKSYPNEEIELHRLAEAVNLTPQQVSNTIVGLRKHRNMGRYLISPHRGVYVYRTVSEDSLKQSTKKEPAVVDVTDASEKEVIVPRMFEQIIVLDDGRVLVKDEEGKAYWLTEA